MPDHDNPRWHLRRAFRDVVVAVNDTLDAVGAGDTASAATATVLDGLFAEYLHDDYCPTAIVEDELPPRLHPAMAAVWSNLADPVAATSHVLWKHVTRTAGG